MKTLHIVTKLPDHTRVSRGRTITEGELITLLQVNINNPIHVDSSAVAILNSDKFDFVVPQKWLQEREFQPGDEIAVLGEFIERYNVS
ncbi:MAG: hypothetical protein V4469_00470 [Patescibacteria group bacterium]